MSVTAIIPLKALSAAKGRLAGVMTPLDRRAFTAWMATRVISACRACDDVDETLVIAGDEAAADVARLAGVAAVVVTRPGLDAALGAADALTRDREATLVLAADLPQVSPVDIAAVIAAGATIPTAVVIAPTHDGGTGALLRRPPGVIVTAYGPGSAAAHERLARAVGATPVLIHRAALASDVDTPAQLPAALALAAEHDVGCA